MSPLYEEVLKILPKIIYIALQFYRYANKRSYNTTPVLQCKIIKNNTGNTLKNWWPTQFQIVINLQKWYIQIFLVKMVIGILITRTHKIHDCRN